MNTALDTTEVEAWSAARSALRRDPHRGWSQRRTTLLLLRFRYHLITRTDDEERQLLAEDSLILAFEGAPDNAQWLDTETAEALLQAEPDENIHPQQAAEFVQRVVDGFEYIAPHLDEIARQRGDELLEAHQRVRAASRQRGVRYSVEPQLPPDVLGIYVYLPAWGSDNAWPLDRTSSPPSAPRARCCRADLLQRIARAANARWADARETTTAPARSSTRSINRAWNAPAGRVGRASAARRSACRKRPRHDPHPRALAAAAVPRAGLRAACRPRRAVEIDGQELPDLARAGSNVPIHLVELPGRPRPAHARRGGRGDRQPAQPAAGLPQPHRRPPVGLPQQRLRCASCATTSA